MTAGSPVVLGRHGRRREAVLLLAALAVSGLAYVAVELGVEQPLTASVVPYVGGLAVLVAAAHLVIRLTAPHADPLLLPVVTLLNGLGLVLIHRLDLAELSRAERLGRDVGRVDAPLQLLWTAVAIVAFLGVLLLVRDVRTLERFTFTAGAAAVALLLLPQLPLIGDERNGARIWIQLGPLSFQPGEVAKLLLVVFFAGYLARTRAVLALVGPRVLGVRLPRARDVGPLVAVWAACLLVLVTQRDLGTSLLYFAVFVALLYAATARVGWVVVAVALFAAGSWAAYRTVSRVQQRVDAWLDPFDPEQYDAAGGSFQLAQGLFGLGEGGLLGSGLGRGRPDVVPFAKTDFITATIGEELGLVGLTAVLVLYALLVQRALRAALSAREGFVALLALGLAVTVAVQVFVVVGGVTGLIPLTGLTLPWVAYGGSSLLSGWVLLALLVRVTDVARRPPVPADRPVPAAPGGGGRASDPADDTPTEAVRTR